MFPVPFVVQTVGTSTQPRARCSSHFLQPRAQSAAALQLHTNTAQHCPPCCCGWGTWNSWVRDDSRNFTSFFTWRISVFCKHCHNTATRLLLPVFCAVFKINTHIFTSRHDCERPLGEIFTSLHPYTPRDDECLISRDSGAGTRLPLLVKEELFTNSLSEKQINLACHGLLPQTGLFTPLLHPTCVADLLYSCLQHFAGLWWAS